MQIKKASFAGWLWAGLAVVVLALLSVSAVFAYTAKLEFSMPVSFKVQNCTLFCDGQVVFSSNEETTASGFEVTPVSDNTLEISCNYSKLSDRTFVVSVNTGFSLQLSKLVIYDAVAFDESDENLNNQTYVSHGFSSPNLTITLLDGIVPESEDEVSFWIRVLAG
ncbi:MAG: hypothetical protein J6K71_00090 [Clostridia bacterium]|nr:hypothetical protein [Clostridia bacterium]